MAVQPLTVNSTSHIPSMSRPAHGASHLKTCRRPHSALRNDSMTQGHEHSVRDAPANIWWRYHDRNSGTASFLCSGPTDFSPFPPHSVRGESPFHPRSITGEPTAEHYVNWHSDSEGNAFRYWRRLGIEIHCLIRCLFARLPFLPSAIVSRSCCMTLSFPCGRMVLWDSDRMGLFVCSLFWNRI